MPFEIVRGRMQAIRDENAAIYEKVSREHIKPTEAEQEKADVIIREISEEFNEKLVHKRPDDIREEILSSIEEKCRALDLPLEKRLRIERTVVMTVLGAGPIEKYIEDPSVTEIVVQRYDNIVVEKGGIVYQTEAVFNSEEHLQNIINRIVQPCNRQINITSPIVDARLPDGSRVNATIPPVSPDGATLTIRKFMQKQMSGQDYIRSGSAGKEMIYFLSRCVPARVSILISGGTGTGKTTFLNMLSGYISEKELIITIEDTLELKLQQHNIRRMEVRPSSSKDMMYIDQKALVKAALRQRPDRIILGEIRDGSVVDLFSAMSTGHEGSMSTIHANSPRNMCDTRIPILYSMNTEAHFSERSIAMQMAEAVQVIVQLSRFPDGSRKVTEVSVVEGLAKDGKVCLREVFLYDRKEGKYAATGYVPEAILTRIRERGLEFDEGIFHSEQ